MGGNGDEHAVALDPESFRARQQEMHELGSKGASLKEYLVFLDQQRQSNREASTGVKKQLSKAVKTTKTQKLWLASGDVSA